MTDLEAALLVALLVSIMVHPLTYLLGALLGARRLAPERVVELRRREGEAERRRGPRTWERDQ